MAVYPKISVIVPMYNASETIRDCLGSISDSDYPDFEIIVVDDASRDDSVSMISPLPCRIVSLDENLGPGKARNKGVDAASGEIVAFTDADCRVQRHWLGNIAKDLARDGVCAVTGGYSGSDNKGIVALFQFYDTCFRQRDISEFVDTCITSNFACRRDIFLELGGFPAQRINEDMEFGIALSRRCKILWDKANGVSHFFDNSLRRYFFEQVSWSESVVRSYLSNPRALAKNNTYKKHEILTHLLLTVLMYSALLAMFWRLAWSVIFIALAVFYFIINIKFMGFVAGSKGRVFSLKMFPFLFIRNAAWLSGIVKAVVR